MKKLFLMAVILAMTFFSAACEKKAVKKVSEDSRIATEAFSVINAIKEAYIQKDVLGIEKNTTQDGFSALRGVIKSFDSAELDFNPVLVEIDQGIVNVNVSWKGIWNKGGKKTQERGMAIFILRGIPLKVDAILRANPFKYPE